MFGQLTDERQWTDLSAEIKQFTGCRSLNLREDVNVPRAVDLVSSEYLKFGHGVWKEYDDVVHVHPMAPVIYSIVKVFKGSIRLPCHAC